MLPDEDWLRRSSPHLHYPSASRPLRGRGVFVCPLSRASSLRYQTKTPLAVARGACCPTRIRIAIHYQLIMGNMCQKRCQNHLSYLRNRTHSLTECSPARSKYYLLRNFFIRQCLLISSKS